MQITEVAIPVPLHNTFDYLCKDKVGIGSRVKVPFGNKKVTGIVLSHKDKSSFTKLREVEEVIDHEVLLSKRFLHFYLGLLTITTIQLEKCFPMRFQKI